MPKERQALPAVLENPTAQKLLISGLIQLKMGSVEIRRGSLVITQDGVDAGVVAAVVLDCSGQEMTHFLLGFVPPTAVYHLVPIGLIERIAEEVIWLSITKDGLANLPRHQPLSS